jgi:hypothetical protein
MSKPVNENDTNMQRWNASFNNEGAARLAVEHLHDVGADEIELCTETDAAQPDQTTYIVTARCERAVFNITYIAALMGASQLSEARRGLTAD